MEPKDCATTVEDTYDKKGGALNCGVTEAAGISKEIICEEVPITDLPAVNSTILVYLKLLADFIDSALVDIHKVIDAVVPDSLDAAVA